MSVRTAPSSTPSSGRRIRIGERLRELARYRELLRNLVVRDLKARYKNSVLGFFWSLLNPLGMMLVFTFVFTVLTPNRQMPRYPLFFLCGFLPWQFFSTGVSASMTSIVGNSSLVSKVYFPREILPTSTVLSNLVNFLLALLVLFGVLVVTQTRLSPYIWLLPVVIAVQTCFVLGMAFFLSTLNVFFRDTVMIMEVVMLAWFFLTPIFYPMAILPSSYEIFGITVNLQRLMYILNPMASLIQYYRDLLYSSTRTNPDFFLRTAVTALIVLVLGYAFFLRFSRRFGEEV